MKIGTIFFLVMFSFLIEDARATEFWPGVSAGMSQAEIQERFPTLVAAEEGGIELPGATKALVLPETDFFGYPFDSQFYFSDDGLVQIVMVNNSLEKKRHIRKACAEMKTLLADDFGPATATRITKSMLGSSDHSIHEDEDLVVRLTCPGVFWPLRMSFHSRKLMDEYAPFGLTMGMSFEDLLPYLEQPVPETINEAAPDEPGMAVVLNSPLSHVPDMPVGEGNLKFRIRASKDNGLCFIGASLSIVEDKGMEYLFSKANLMPNRDLFGTPSDVGGMFGEYKFSFLPKPTPLASSDTWVTTANDRLPGSIDKMIYMSGTAEVDGVKTHVESVQIQFTNSFSCGLARNDLEGFD